MNELHTEHGKRALRSPTLHNPLWYCCNCGARHGPLRLPARIPNLWKWTFEPFGVDGMTSNPTGGEADDLA